MANVTGLITVNMKQVLEVDADPSAAAGTVAPLGSLAMYDDGSVAYLYQKTGALDTAWTVFSPGNDWTLSGNALTGGSASTPNEKFGSTNDYDVKFIRNDIEEMRIQSSAVLVGLSASIGGRLQVAGTTLGADMMAQILDPTGNPVIDVTKMSRLTTVGAVTSTQDFAIPNDKVALVECRIAARQTGGATGSVGDGASYVRSAHFKNIAGSATMFQQQTDYTYEIDNQLNATLSASGASARMTVTGVASRNFTWGMIAHLLITGV